ncbi:hypothetical protein QE177_15520 (plasmid) [Arsenophonus sp. aPb]|uniref:hypothetical protein n=1 Tax=Arsenophonus sp. aPb TaxID=3041619 RepID=UPI00246992DA|nr:hypothetical protein [Arsenophonus sp. aPb]WGL99923.1 hypothetical protein QE177_15520 [Arsenophonus sp. aPb]
MDEKEPNPRSARDALMIELIGDLGRVNDQITALPSDIKNAVEGSLRLIADAVEQTEKSAKEVLEKFQAEIKSSADNEADNFKQKMAINERTTMLSEKHHTKTHNLSVIMAFLVIFNTLFCGCMLGFLFYSQQKYEEKMENYADAYQIQQAAIANLPEKIQQQFEEEKRKLLSEK